jgi:hypothetical protein
MKTKRTAALIAMLLPCAAIAQIPDEPTKAISDEVKAIQSDRSLSPAQKVDRFTSLATREDIPKHAKEIATVARIQALVNARQGDQALTEADAFIASGPESPYQRYLAATVRLSQTPAAEKDAYVEAADLPDDLAVRLRLAAATQIADAKAKTDPSAAFDYLLASPYWTRDAAGSGFPLPSTLTKLAEYAAAARRPDALQWAKANYDLCDLAQINRAIDVVTRAFRATDGNIVRANAFIDHQKTGEGDNPLAGTAMPPALLARLGEIDLASVPSATRIQLLIAKGDFPAALDAAKTEYATASRENLSRSVDRIAAVLKAHDGNVLRANAYIQSQKDQKPFDLTLE